MHPIRRTCLVVALCAALLPCSNLFAALNATTLFPANGATNVCVDTFLRITFDAPPAYRTTGTIKIYSSSDDSVVDTLDMIQTSTSGNTQGTQSRTIAGTTYNTYPVILSSNVATIFPHLGVLTTNKSYYVKIDPGTFTNSSSGAYAGITNKTNWTFTTKAVNPPGNATNFTLAVDGSGDFCTVQGLIDFLPNGNTQPRLVYMKKGLYQEINRLNGKHNITFRGEDRKETIICYTNNVRVNSGTRYMFYITANDIAFDNLTITNASIKLSSNQAEAVNVNGARCIFNNMTLCSFQDTLEVQDSGNQSYFYNSLVQGDTDFIWGVGTVMFKNCEIRAANKGHNCQMRTDTNHYGAVFVDCSLTKGANFTGHNLGRMPGSASNPGLFGNVLYINCRMDTHISPVAWDQGGFSPDNVRWWEYQSVDMTGTNLVDVSQRASFSKQVNAAVALPLREATNVFGTISSTNTPLGNGWQPKLAPNILTQPTNKTVNAGQSATFVVTATGIPDPTYRWQKNGTDVPGGTNATLIVSNAQANATYTVVVSNTAAAVTSSNAVLTVNGGSTAPSFGSASYGGGQFQFGANVTTGTNYTVEASTNMTNWSAVFSTNAPGNSFTWADDTVASNQKRFFRLSTGP